MTRAKNGLAPMDPVPCRTLVRNLRRLCKDSAPGFRRQGRTPTAGPILVEDLGDGSARLTLTLPWPEAVDLLDTVQRRHRFG